MLEQRGRWVRRGSTIVILGLDDGELEIDSEGWDRPTLRRGSRGSDVRDLQARLAGAGFDPGPADGIFGSNTDSAVRAYQRARALDVDGIVGAQTWSALDAEGRTRAPTTPPPVRAPAGGSDPAIEALSLAEPARTGAYLLKATLPWVRFTSGRRDPARQAWAMAGNVVTDRGWIARTYARNAVSIAAQQWVDAHPEARSQQAISDGLLGVFRTFSDRDLGRLSYHLSGLAFDVQPVPAQEPAFRDADATLPGKKELLTKEGDLTIWHVGF